MNGRARGEDVELKVLERKAEVPLLGRWLRGPHVVRWWGAQDRHVTMLAQRSRAADAMITAGGKPGGYLCWQTCSPPELETAGLSDLPGDLVDIDILIGELGFLGRGVGPKALVLLLAKLRGDGVGFAGVGTSISSRAAISAFEKVGFRPFRDFEDPEYGPCRYMVAQLRAAAEPERPAYATRRLTVGRPTQGSTA